MNGLEWIITIALAAVIGMLVAVAFLSTTETRPRRYVAPGDDLYHAYKSWGGKG